MFSLLYCCNNGKSLVRWTWTIGDFMKKLRYFIFVLLAWFASASAFALQFGSAGEDFGYKQKADTTEQYFGTLKVLHVYPGAFLGAHDYYLTINDKDVLSIMQGMGHFTRKYAVASVNLPNGKYNVKLRTLPFKKIMVDFDVVIKAGKTIAILVKKEQADIAVSDFGLIYSEVEFYENKDFDDENLKALIDEKIGDAENVYKAELAAKDNLIKAQEYATEQARTYYERKAKTDAENDKRAKEYEAKKALEDKLAAKKEAEKVVLEQRKLQAEDDAACRSYGAVQGTQAYVTCRATFATKRAEAKERAEANKAMSDKFESYMAQQERLRLEERQAQDARADALQKSADAERKRRERRQNLDDAENLLRGAARMGGQQETITCTSTFGNTINCRK